MNDKNMSEQEAAGILRQFNEGRSNLHSFFTRIIENDSTTKTGNLSEEELGVPKIPQRTMKELEAFCEDICDEPEWAKYFEKIAEIQTSTSLSKDALLLRLSVTSKKELADVTPSRKKNKGWFKKEPAQQPIQ